MNPVSYEVFEKEMQDFLYMDSTEVLRILAAVFCVHYYQGVNPVWLFLIAPSSSAKTELLKPLAISNFVTNISQITTKTFVSGFIPAKPKKGDEPATPPKKTGLLDRATEKAAWSKQSPMIVIKDFTTILNMRADERNIVMSQLREVKDGNLTGEYGNGITSLWSGRMGFVAAVTDQIEEAIADSAKFGDRYLYYRMDAINHEKAIERMIVNRTRDTKEIIKRAHGCLESLALESAKTFGKYGPVPPGHLIQTGGRINALAIFATQLRTPVIRDNYRREITAVYPPESPTRHVSQLTSFASGLMALRGGEWSDEDFPLLRKLALGSAPVTKLKLAESLFFRGTLSTTDCADAVSLPKSAVRYPLDDLFAAKLLKRRNPEKSDSFDTDKSYNYSLSEETRTLMLRAGYPQDDMPHELTLQFDGKETPF